MCCSDDDEADVSLLSNTLVRTQAASLGPEQHSHRNAVASDNTVGCYAQEERRRHASARIAGVGRPAADAIPAIAAGYGHVSPGLGVHAMVGAAQFDTKMHP